MLTVVANKATPNTHTVTLALRGHGCLIDLSFIIRISFLT